jgi:ABC-type Na+ efflux pump permease subunit
LTHDELHAALQETLEALHVAKSARRRMMFAACLGVAVVGTAALVLWLALAGDTFQSVPDVGPVEFSDLGGL